MANSPMTAQRADPAPGIMSPWLACYVVVFLALSVAKAPTVLLEPRFWAEEGDLYYAALRTLPAWDALTFVAKGNLQLLINAVVYVAAKVPILYAPAVTTYAAYLVELLVALLIYRFVLAYDVNRLVGLLLLAAWLFLAPHYETWTSMTNVQWVCSASLLLVLILPDDAVGRNLGKSAVWAALCGLTGVASWVLAPAFLARAYLDRSKAFALLGAILTACALVQFVIIITHGGGDRSFAFGPRILMLPLLLQTVLTPMIGVEPVESFAAPLRQGGMALAASPLVYLAAIPWMALAIALAGLAVRRALVAILAGVWPLASIVYTFGALGPTLELVSAIAGARYYLLGAMCFCLLLAWGSTARAPLARWAAVGLLVLIVSVSVVQRLRSSWIPDFTQGSAWKAEIAKCVPQSACVVTIWPQRQNRRIGLGTGIGP
jgi:hypothetical protein